MSSRGPFMSRAAWLVLGVSVLAFATVLGVGWLRNHHHVDTTAHVPASAAKAGVELKTLVSMKQEGNGLYDVVANLTVVNSSDAAIYYVGIPCYAPARARFASTLGLPASRTYSPAAAGLRTHVMDYRRSLDEIGSFAQEEGTPSGAGTACDESAPPVLPGHQRINYTMTATIGTSNQLSVDPLTTEVVTTLQIGSLAASQPGLPPSPLRVVDTVEARTSLKTLTDLTKPSSANYGEVSRHFDLLMRNAGIAAWVNAQDPSLWGAARLMDPYPTATSWRLEAFNHAWAVPLVVTGTDSTLKQVRIPDEPWKAPLATDAVLPPAAVSTDKVGILYRDLYVGDLVLPSGRVMVGDVVSSDGMLKFDYGLQAGGRYPIHIVTTRPRYEGDEYEAVAWEELILSSSPVAEWKPAVPVGHSASELKTGELFIWGTDGGSGGFASPEAMKFMDATLSEEELGLYGQMGQREEANDWLWGLLTVDNTTGANVFGTSTGADGGFPVLLGVDAQGRPAVLLSDFGNYRMKFTGVDA